MGFMQLRVMIKGRKRDYYPSRLQTIFSAAIFMFKFKLGYGKSPKQDLAYMDVFYIRTS